MNIKIRLLQLGKKQIDLLEELIKRGYVTMCSPTLSAMINNRINTPLAERVREEIYKILNEWEQAQKGG